MPARLHTCLSGRQWLAITFCSSRSKAAHRFRHCAPKSAQQDSLPSTLDSSRSLAATRAAESSKEEPLVNDPYAASLVQHGGHSPVEPSGPAAALDALVARFLDEQMLKAVSLVNMDRKQEYNQVVLVGDAMDTRPFRLPWPTGTVIYLVGAGEVHEMAEAVLADQGARVPRGCLLRRVSANLQQQRGGGTGSFSAALERAGFRGDRLSVWGLQGCTTLGLGVADVEGILTDTSNLAAFDSLILGELPAMGRGEVENLMASFGLLGAPLDVLQQRGGDTLDGSIWPGEARPWLFIAHQKRLSLRQMGIYSEHVAAAEDANEDFEGNFS